MISQIFDFLLVVYVQVHHDASVTDILSTLFGLIARLLRSRGAKALWAVGGSVKKSSTRAMS